MRNPLDIAGLTDRGRKRAKNEDNYAIDPDLGLIIVADGMGGHSAGEVASQLAVQLCLEQARISFQTNGAVPVANPIPPSPEFDSRTLLLGNCIKFACAAIYEASLTSESKRNMGTTVVAAVWLDGKLGVAHVGDSRLYMFRDGDLTLCTNDHSFVQEQVDRGLLAPEDAEKSDLRNMLTRSVGVAEDVQVDINEVRLAEGDYILLCSDGLNKMLDDDQIVSSFAPNRSPREIARELVERANQAGGHDNVTVVVARVEGSPSSWSAFADKMKELVNRKG